MLTVCAKIFWDFNFDIKWISKFLYSFFFFFFFFFSSYLIFSVFVVQTMEISLPQTVLTWWMWDFFFIRLQRFILHCFIGWYNNTQDINHIFYNSFNHLSLAVYFILSFWCKFVFVCIPLLFCCHQLPFLGNDINYFSLMQFENAGWKASADYRFTLFILFIYVLISQYLNVDV